MYWNLLFLASFLVLTSGSLDQEITLQVNAYYPVENLPSGASLFLRGSGLPSLSWNNGIKMRYLQNGQFSLTLSFSKTESSSIIEFKILVQDQTWMIGANAFLPSPNQSSSVDVFPWFYTQNGEYAYHYDIYSPQLKNTRDIVVYTPPSYLENTYKTISNVLIMHDGQNLFNASTAAFGCWYCQDTVDSLVVEGGMDEVIIVGVDNTINRTDEYTYSYDSSVKAGGQGNVYLDFLVETVVPLVQGWYRVDTARENLGILGSSLGGLISCYAGYTRNDIFGKSGCMSSSFWWNNEDFNNEILIENPMPDHLTVYLDSGNAGIDDDDVNQTRRVRNHMEEIGFVMNETLWYFLDQGGQHNEYYWGRRFWVPMTDLYPPSMLNVTTI